MHTSALEQAALTQDRSENTAELPASPPQSETQEHEVTALVPTEPDVIEGEVIEIDSPDEEEEYTSPKQKPYWLFIPFTIFLCLVFVAGSLLLPVLTPSATITLIPVEKHVTFTTTIQVQGRSLPALTLSQSISVSATGKRHQNAARAYGTITFYNGLLSRQTIAAGTILTGADKVQIITDQAASIPPASNTTPPTFGQATVKAHAVQPGAKGNISPYDINGSCCGASILVKNTTAFTGGQNAREYPVITGRDIENAATSLKTSLQKSEQGAFNAQLTEGEALIPPPCTQTTTANHRIGEETKEVTITVSETCEGFAYDAHTLHLLATQIITHQSTQTGYTILGDVTASVIHASITDQARGIATLTVKLDATSIYQITPGEKQQLVNMIAGKSKSSALHTLLSLPGIQGASIRCTGGDILPHDPNHITISILYNTISPSLF